MNRRFLLATPALLALGACGTNANPKTQLQTIAGLATAGIDAVSASVLTKPDLAPDKVAKIMEAQASADAANAAIQKSATTDAANAQALAVAIQIAKAVLLGFVPAGSDAAMALAAAFALVPTLLAAAGVTATPMARLKPEMSPEEAIQRLHRYTGK